LLSNYKYLSSMSGLPRSNETRPDYVIVRGTFCALHGEDGLSSNQRPSSRSCLPASSILIERSISSDAKPFLPCEEAPSATGDPPKWTMVRRYSITHAPVSLTESFAPILFSVGYGCFLPSRIRRLLRAKIRTHPALQLSAGDHNYLR
jgi:hypothetical protein